MFVAVGKAIKTVATIKALNVQAKLLLLNQAYLIFSPFATLPLKTWRTTKALLVIDFFV